MSNTSGRTLADLLDERYDDAPIAAVDDPAGTLRSMASRASHRQFSDRAVAPELIETLCAVALASPTKSDLQQRDIILLTSEGPRRQLAELVAGQAWVADAPLVAVFCGNNRRQRLLHDWHDVTFANDHLDAFFNAAVDAGVALSAFVTAAESVGLGCCPISAVRNDAAAVSALLGLPDHVFPVAGLAIGYPVAEAAISPRLPLGMTVHQNRYQEDGLQAAVRDYEHGREDVQPYASQRFTDVFGVSERYGWSEDKVRQYSQPERETFGAFVRSKGFRLE